MSRDMRHKTPGGEAAARRAAMLRVDHAGEQGAVRIYEGQLAVFGARPETAGAAQAIRTMAKEEARHLAAFDDLLRTEQVRPTALRPLWDAAGFMLGAASALLGEKAAMACTAAVEEAIGEHYASQAQALEGDDPKLKAMIEDFAGAEEAHRTEALAAGAEDAPAYRLFSSAIKAGCRLAIRLSEKI